MKNYLILFFFNITFAFSQQQFSVFFETKKFNLTTLETKRLNDWIKNNQKVKIVGINGFTDEDGSIGLNDTLSQRRVQTVFDIVKNKLAMRNDFKSRSFGKLHQHDVDKSKNRKATIFYLLEKDLPLENEILGIKNELVKIEKPKTKLPEFLDFKMPNGETERMVLDTIFMSNLSHAKAGDYLIMKNLNFHLNTFGVVKASVARLYDLLYVMQQNPQLVIQVHGHICCNPKDPRDLSTQRAKAVKLFLVGNGIDANRVSFKGFGGNMPKFAIPEKNEIEAAENRRVEILVVSN